MMWVALLSIDRVLFRGGWAYLEESPCWGRIQEIYQLVVSISLWVGVWGPFSIWGLLFSTVLSLSSRIAIDDVSNTISILEYWISTYINLRLLQSNQLFWISNFHWLITNKWGELTNVTCNNKCMMLDIHKYISSRTHSPLFIIIYIIFLSYLDTQQSTARKARQGTHIYSYLAKG